MNYLDEPSKMTGVLVSGKKRGRREIWKEEKDLRSNGDSEGGHGPKNICNLLKLEKIRRWISHEISGKKCCPSDCLVLAH